MPKSNGSVTAGYDPDARRQEIQSTIGTIVTGIGRLFGLRLDEDSTNIEDRVSALKTRGEELVEEASHRATEATEQTRATIERNPISAVIIALGVGFLLAAILRRR